MSSYRDALEAWAIANGSDGCTTPSTQAFQVCCWEHDHAYVTGQTLRGVRVTKAEADQRFRDCIQAHSSLRWLSPLSWWRWLAVHWYGRGVWTLRPAQYAYTPRETAFAEATRARRRIFATFKETRA